MLEFGPYSKMKALLDKESINQSRYGKIIANIPGENRAQNNGNLSCIKKYNEVNI